MNIEDLVPHRGDMSLLNSVISFSDTSLRASAVVNDSIPYLIDGVVSSWIGIEYMAQTIAAWAGVRALQKGEPIKLGMLVGTRNYTVDTGQFTLMCYLDIQVHQIIEGANGLSVFECKIDYKGGEATANINVFQPDDINEFLGAPT